MPARRAATEELALKPGSVILLVLAVTGCSSWRSAQIHHDAGTAASPAQVWAPPADAVPPPSPKAEAIAIPAGGPLSLAQIVDIALANNTTTRQAWLSARAAQASLGSSESAYLPEIDVNGNLSYSRTPSQSGNTSSQTVLAPSISLNYLLFDFGGREAQVEEARQTLIAADYLHNQAIQDVVLRTQQAYYGYLDAKALLTAQKATIAERQAQLDAANARHDAGVATIADVLQAKTALSQATLTRYTIEGNLRAIEGALATAMGLPTTTAFDLGDLPLDVPTQTIAQKVDELIGQAVTARPDLAAARADAERAKARIREVRAQGLPTISLNSSLGRSLFEGGFRGTPISAAVSLRFPLFTGWRNTFDVREAEALAAVSAERVRGLEQSVDLQVWTSYYALQTAAQRLTTVRDLLDSATQSADVARNRYRAGVGNIIDLLTAQAALESARAEEVQARADWFVAVAQLAHDTGSLR
jgi:TolC family type I secretion outer membrane protein